MKKWTIRIKEHPYVGRGDYMFEDMAKMEEFVDKNDIQIDHIDRIVQYKDGKATSFLCVDKECVSSTRMLLVKKPIEPTRFSPQSL